MGIFKRTAAPAQPLEFGFMSAEEWASFNGAVMAAAKRCKLTVESVVPGAIVVQGAGSLGLLNLAQVCHASDGREWPQVIEAHLLGVTQRIGSSEFSVGQLRVRLYPDDYAPWDQMVWRAYAESVHAVVVVDLPTMIRAVSPAELAETGLTIEDAWSAAWAQTRSNERPEEHEVVDARGAKVHSFFGSGILSASYVEFLPDLVGEVGENGALVSIPRRHTILAHVINDLSVLQAIDALIPWTRQLYSEGPGSVSAHLYWRSHNGLMWLPVQVADEAIDFYPPQEFVDCLNSLPPAT